jgi:hypothetical protein
MPYVGIRKHEGHYTLTDPMSVESTTTSLSTQDIAWIMENPDEAQPVLANLYSRKTGIFRDLFYTFMNENPMWHIHGIIATAAIVLSVFTQEETALLLLFAGGTSLWALFKRVRQYKKWAAALLSLTYAHTAVWMITHEIRPAAIITSITLSLISIILAIEWNKKSYKTVTL